MVASNSNHKLHMNETKISTGATTQAESQTGLEAKTERPRWVKNSLWLLKWTAAVWLLIAGSSFAAWLCWQAGVDLQTLNKVQDAMRHLRPWLWLGHLAVFGLMAWRWQALVAWGQRRGIVKDFELAQVLALRNKVLAFFAAYILLVAIGPRNLIALWA
jgi:hypothetical protein